MAFCENCGASLAEGNRFCQVCGNVISAPFTPEANNAAPVTPPTPPIVTPAPEAGNQQPTYGQPEQPYGQPNYQTNNQGYQQTGYQPNYGQQQGYQQPPYGQPPYGGGYQPPVPPSGVTVGKIYNNCFAVLSRKPILLWGLSLLYTLLTCLASIFGVLPIISVPICLVLEVGMCAVFLDGYRGKTVNSDQLFLGFKNFGRFAGGMAWMYLWVLIWSMIPFAGWVLGIIKAYSYRFVPFILLNDPEISATEALRVSMRLTQGYKAKMFVADLLVGVIIFVALLIFGLLAGVAGFFVFLLLIVVAIIIAFAPLVLGLFQAAFYDEIEKEKR